MVTRSFKGKYREHFDFVCGRWEFRFNVVRVKIEYRQLKNGKPDKRRPWLDYDDRGRSNILLEVCENCGDKDLPNSKLDMLIESEFISQDYDPFQEYFDKLDLWDKKTDYIGQLSKTIKTDDSERFREILERFLVGTLNCLLVEDQVNDVCLTFQGGQGVGKTRWFQNLMPKEFRHNYFNETNIDTKNKDHVLWLSQYWFIHLDELESLNTNGIEAMKSFITRKHIALRQAYGRYSANYIRRASFLGSVNKNKFLTDTTGNRRWLVFRVYQIIYNHNVDLDKLWSQVYSLWEDGYKHWFDGEETAELNKANEEFREMSTEEELVLENFEFCDSEDVKGEYMTSSDVIEKIIEVKPLLRNNLNSRKVSRVLSTLCDSCNGFKKKPRNVSNYYLKFIGTEPGSKSIDANAFVEPKEEEKTNKSANIDDLPF